jgi:hypothetical protein
LLDFIAGIVMWLFTMITWHTYRIIYTILFTAALLVPFFIGQYIDGETFTGWTYVGDWSCRLCD